MKKSKCEKAAERYMHREFDAGTLPSVQEAYKSGARALLRYAKKKAEFMTLPADHIRLNAITIQVLEEWVKGEE